MTDQIKNKKPSGLPYTRYVNRNLGRFFAKYLQFLTPNQITVIGFLSFILAVIFLFKYFGSSMVVVPYIFLFINYVLDSVDGQVARLRGMSSKLGEWLDQSLDGLRIILLNVAFIILLLPYLPNQYRILYTFLVFIPLIFQSSHYLIASLKSHILKMQIGHMLDESRDSIKTKIVRWCSAPADFGIFIMITLIGFNPTWFLWIYILYGFYYFFVLLVTSYMTIKAVKNEERENFEK
jgi:phosphatidylglycerophosphate synthase